MLVYNMVLSSAAHVPWLGRYNSDRQQSMPANEKRSVQPRNTTAVTLINSSCIVVTQKVFPTVPPSPTPFLADFVSHHLLHFFPRFQRYDGCRLCSCVWRWMRRGLPWTRFCESSTRLTLNPRKSCIECERDVIFGKAKMSLLPLAREWCITCSHHAGRFGLSPPFFIVLE